MRSRLMVAALLATTIAAVAVAAAVGAAAGGHESRRAGPSLTLIGRNPLTVRGRHFTPRARVQVTLVSARLQGRRATADAGGTFTVAFSPVDRCTAWTVSASQGGHSPVVLRGPKPLCAPARTP